MVYTGMVDKMKVDLSWLDQGFVAQGRCRECGKDTFSADGVCMACKVEIVEEDRKFFLVPNKRCSKCTEIKPVSQFYRNASASDGFNNQCKVCHKESTATWRAKVMPRLLDQVQAWRAANPEQFKAINAAITARKQADKYGVESTATWQDFLLLHRRPCFNCGIEPAGGADHIIPFAKHGPNTVENLQPACLDCNRRKNATDADVFATLKTDDCG